MNPQMLVDSASTAPLPAPWWFVEFFKVLGFTLHLVPMHLWFAGLLVAMILRAGGGHHARTFSRRMAKQMPVLVAFGVNFGIVPLLFLQLAYYQFFYPATILMAWFWIAIVAILIPAYYGVYIYAFGLRDDDPAGPSLFRRWIGWGSAVLFIVIGFLFVNGLSLASSVDAWPAVWKDHQVAGAATGTGLAALYVPMVWPRWLMMFGLALGTTAAWIVLDAAWFARRETDDYRRWAGRFAFGLAVVGAAWFAAAGSWYVFGTWSSPVRETMFAWPAIILTALTALSPGLPVVLIALLAHRGLTRTSAAIVAAAQFSVLAINAVSRQVVQNLEIGKFADLAGQPADVQWSPLILFLVIFALGAVVILWMVAQVVKAARST